MNQLVVHFARWGVRCGQCKAKIARSQLMQGLPNERCLKCSGLVNLVFVGLGDVALTRRSTRESPLHAVHARNRRLDESFAHAFASHIRAEFPAIPNGVDHIIAQHACMRAARNA